MYFQQVSKSKAATKELGNSFSAQEFRIQRLLVTLMTSYHPTELNSKHIHVNDLPFKHNESQFPHL